MEFLIYFFIGTVALFALLAAIAIWSPRRTAVRVVALVTAALMMPLGYLQLTELLSRSKPIDFLAVLWDGSWWNKIDLLAVLGRFLVETN